MINRIIKKSIFDIKKLVSEINEIKYEPENKLENFIKTHSKNGIEFDVFKFDNKKDKNDNFFNYYSELHKNEVVSLIGEHNYFFNLINKNEDGHIYEYILPQVSLKTHELIFNCSTSQCKGKISYDYTKSVIKENIKHSILFNQHELTLKSNILDEKMGKKLNNIIGIFSYGKEKIKSFNNENKEKIKSKIVNNKEIRVMIESYECDISKSKLLCKNIFYKYLGKNKYLDSHFHKTDEGKIFAYSFLSFCKRRNSFLFICNKCHAKAYYDLNKGNFKICKKHTQECASNRYIKNTIKREKALKIFNSNPDIKDIQFIFEKTI